jgi:hypothetical protein
MSERWYLAARFRKRYFLQTVVRPDLLRAGHVVTSRWIDDCPGDECAAAARRDLADIEIADGVILFCDPPRCATRGGKTFESAYAFSLGKKLIAIGTEPEHIFQLLPDFQFFPDWDTARDVICSPIIARRSRKIIRENGLSVSVTRVTCAVMRLNNRFLQ